MAEGRNRFVEEEPQGIVPVGAVGDKANAIKKAADIKKLSGNIEMAQQGAALLGVDDSTTEGGAVSGALSGASMGAKLGPMGAAVGGVIGGIAGGLGASAKQEAAHQAAKQRAKAEHANNLANIEKDKDRKIQNALESMKGAFSKNLQSTKGVKL